MAENAAVDMSAFLKNIASLTLGSGKTTEEESSPTGMANIQGLLSTIIPQITGTASTDAVVQNIIRQTQLKFQPINFAGNNASGLYGSSTVAALQGQFMADAVGQSADAVLKHQTEAAKTAASLSLAAVNAGKTKTSKTDSAIHPAITGAITAAMLAKSLFNKKKEDGTGTPNPPPGTSDVFGAARDAAASESGGTLSQTVGTGGQSIGGTTSTLGNVEEGFSAAEGLIGSNTAVESASTIADASVAPDGIGTTAQYLADTAGAGEAGATVLEGGAEIAEGAEVAEGASLLEEVGPLAAASAVICTELNRQGILSTELWSSGKWYHATISPYTKLGYHFWAVPYVKVMQHSQLATELVKPFALGRYKYLAGEKNFCGWLTVTVGEKVCYFLGRILAPLMLDLPQVVR